MRLSPHIPLLLWLTGCVFAQTLITSLPYTITSPGVYEYRGPLSYYPTSAAAISIAADNVRLRLDGPMYLPGGSNTTARGVEAFGRSGVRIVGGEIHGALYGINLQGCADARVANVEVCAWYIGIVSGVDGAPNHGSRIVNCRVRDTGGSTLPGYTRPVGFWLNGSGRLESCRAFNIYRPSGDFSEAMGVNVVSGSFEIFDCLIAQPAVLERTYGYWGSAGANTIIRHTTFSRWSDGIGVPSGAAVSMDSVSFANCTTSGVGP